MRLDELTIIVPVFNERSALQDVINDLSFVFPDNRILYIDDGSQDGSAEILAANEVNFISHEANFGYGRALKTGIRCTKTKFVAFFDADGQHNAQDLLLMTEEPNYFDMVVGSRGSESYFVPNRVLGKKVLSIIANHLCNRKIPDLNSGLRIVKTSKIKKLLGIMPDGFSFSTTSTIALHQLQLTIAYLPITTAPRVGQSSVRIFSDGFSTLTLILRLVMLFKPLKIFVPISLSFVALTIISLASNWIYAGGNISEATIFFALASIIIFMMGLISDQIVTVRQLLAFQDDDSSGFVIAENQR